MLLKHFLWSALEYHFPTLSASLRTDIHDIVGSKHHILIVLNNDYCIADVTQLFQGIDETIVITLMKSDGRLVEDIEHINQLTTNLGSKTNTLTLTTRKGCRLARE